MDDYNQFQESIEKSIYDNLDEGPESNLVILKDIIIKQSIKKGAFVHNINYLMDTCDFIKYKNNLYEDLKRNSEDILKKIEELDMESHIEEIRRGYVTLNYDLISENTKNVFYWFEEILKIILTDLRTLKHILFEENKVLAPSNIVLNNELRKKLYLLFDDENSIYSRIKNNLSTTLKEFKCSHDPKSPGHIKYDFVEILPPVSSDHPILKKVYKIYKEVFADENELSDIKKQIESLSGRYEGRFYHYWVIFRGIDPIGAVIYDYFETDYKYKYEPSGVYQNIGFSIIWYVFLSKEHRSKNHLYKESICFVNEKSACEAKKRGNLFIGVFAEVNDPDKMTEQQIKDEVRNGMNPVDRWCVFKSRDFLKCDFYYSQPAETIASEQVDYVSLLFRKNDVIGEIVPVEMMKSILKIFFEIEYFMDTNINNKNLFNKIALEIDNKDGNGVNLLPMNLLRPSDEYGSLNIGHDF